MSLFISDESFDAYNQVKGAPYKAELSPEVLGAAAANEASKVWFENFENNGNPRTLAQARELVSSATGAFIDRMIESKGLGYLDRNKAKHLAMKNFEEQLNDFYA